MVRIKLSSYCLTCGRLVVIYTENTVPFKERQSIRAIPFSFLLFLFSYSCHSMHPDCSPLPPLLSGPHPTLASPDPLLLHFHSEKNRLLSNINQELCIARCNKTRTQTLISRLEEAIRRRQRSPSPGRSVRQDPHFHC